MASSKNPKYLRLKPEYYKKFLDESKKHFGDSHISELRLAIFHASGVSISKATIARILSGNRGNFDNVRVICEYYENLIESEDWLDACESYEVRFSPNTVNQGILSEADIDFLVNQARGQIRFSFEAPDQSKMLDKSLWVQENFVELDMLEVSQVPSEYPALNREVLLNSEESIEDEFDRVGIRLLRGRRTSGSKILTQYRRLFVYGDPGSGKSSYLQSVALKCRDGVSLSQYIPVFVEIRQYSASNSVATIMTFVEQMFESWGMKPGDVDSILREGRVLFLFDGLDEALEGKRASIQFMLQEMLDNYQNCRFVFASRLASVFSFRGVQKVIISPFYSNKQIPQFVRRWFVFHGSTEEVANSMLEKLRSPRYASIREISRRPVLLNLLCVTYDSNGDFPTQRAGVFSSGISALARQGQSSSLAVENVPNFKEKDIKNILGQIASYFFVNLNEQILFAIRDVERIITRYCQEIYHVNPAIIDGRNIIKNIEQFNGLLVRWGEIYCSFSHLTYQEYFTAEHLISTNSYKSVYNYLADRRWNFVIELVSELVPREYSWEFFLGFKMKIDSYVNGDIKVVGFLKKVDRAATFVSYATTNSGKPHIQTLIRAWYFAMALEDSGGNINFSAYQKKFDLPDFHLATSMVDNNILQGHELLYKAYHYCSEADKAASFELCIQRLQTFFRNDSQRQDVVDGWLHLIGEQKTRFDTIEDWWEARRHRWQSSLANFLKTLGLPFVHGLNSEQVERLRTYYRVSRLLSTCINRSNLPSENFSELADSLLRVTNLSSDGMMNFPDSAE